MHNSICAYNSICINQLSILTIYLHMCKSDHFAKARSTRIPPKSMLNHQKG